MGLLNRVPHCNQTKQELNQSASRQARDNFSVSYFSYLVYFWILYLQVLPGILSFFSSSQSYATTNHQPTTNKRTKKKSTDSSFFGSVQNLQTNKLKGTSLVWVCIVPPRKVAFLHRTERFFSGSVSCTKSDSTTPTTPAQHGKQTKQSPGRRIPIPGRVNATQTD